MDDFDVLFKLNNFDHKPEQTVGLRVAKARCELPGVFVVTVAKHDNHISIYESLSCYIDISRKVCVSGEIFLLVYECMMGET